MKARITHGSTIFIMQKETPTANSETLTSLQVKENPFAFSLHKNTEDDIYFSIYSALMKIRKNLQEIWYIRCKKIFVQPLFFRENHSKGLHCIFCFFSFLFFVFFFFISFLFYFIVSNIEQHEYTYTFWRVSQALTLIEIGGCILQKFLASCLYV